MDNRSVIRRGPLQMLLHFGAVEAMLFAYFTPDTVMPLGSALAAGVGVVLMFWYRGRRLIRSALERVRGGEKKAVIEEREDSRPEQI